METRNAAARRRLGFVRTPSTPTRPTDMSTGAAADGEAGAERAVPEDALKVSAVELVKDFTLAFGKKSWRFTLCGADPHRDLLRFTKELAETCAQSHADFAILLDVKHALHEDFRCNAEVNTTLWSVLSHAHR